MFTGIIESIGEVIQIERKGTNLLLTVQSPFSQELKIDQSVAHHGVCLTVIAVNGKQHTVEAVRETLERTNLGLLKVGSYINLERALVAGSRLDGHYVQGHVDQCGECIEIEEQDGSWKFWFEYQSDENNLLVEKGSISIDGVSLTVVDAEPFRFSVVVIPYTFEHTCFGKMQPGEPVNLEFDILGKYVMKGLSVYQSNLRKAG